MKHRQQYEIVYRQLYKAWYSGAGVIIRLTDAELLREMNDLLLKLDCQLFTVYEIDKILND